MERNKREKTTTNVYLFVFSVFQDQEKITARIKKSPFQRNGHPTSKRGKERVTKQRRESKTKRKEGNGK